jgi:hypothetical protein
MRNQSPTTTWPVSDSKFKALVYLNSGSNTFTLEFVPKGSKTRHSSTWHLIHHPMISCPAVKLVIVHAKDSPHSNLGQMRSETTPLSIAMAKYRLAAYLWQNFLSEQMNTKEVSRRTFQLENEWRESSLFTQDIHSHEMRNEAPVHVVSLDKTLEEVSHMSRDEFVSSVEQAITNRFYVSERQKSYFSCLFMDSEWSNQKQAPRRGYAYGGPGIINGQSLNLAIHGDYLLSSYPSSIDRVTAAFSDETPMEGTPEPVRWKCATAGIGGHLQQFLRMLGLKSQAYGLMSDESAHFAAMFSLYAAQQSPAPRLHPLDLIRLRYNATMRSPFGPIERIRPNTAPSFWGINDSTIKISSRAGLLAIEVYMANDTVCKHWINLLDGRSSLQYSHNLTLNDLTKLVLNGRSSRLSMKPGPFNLLILTADGVATPINDFEHFARGLTVEKTKSQLHRSSLIGLPVGNTTFQSAKFPENLRMMSLTVYHNPGVCVTGMEFVFELGQRVLFGSRQAESGKAWPLRAIDGESLMGIEVCVKDVLMGLRLFTSSGRLSPWFGCAESCVE